MYINEVIERSDELLNNEYSTEEKYHWCDVVSAELLSKAVKKMKCAVLTKWDDKTFLLPEDCDFTRIEKLIADNMEISKCDMSSFGMIPLYGENRRRFIRVGNSPKRIEVIYRSNHLPIRRILLKDANIEIDDGIIMGRECPFVGGDTIKALINDTEYIFHIIARSAVFDEETDEMKYRLECSVPKELTGQLKADMERVVTDKTVCEAPYDEMYIYYICAQICFYQQDLDMYRQLMARYNEQKEEYKNSVKAYSPMTEDSRFKNWW